MRFLGTHLGETYGPPEWESRKLSEALSPSFCDLFSERRGWVKNLIPKSEARLCKGQEKHFELFEPKGRVLKTPGASPMGYPPVGSETCLVKPETDLDLAWFSNR